MKGRFHLLVGLFCLLASTQLLAQPIFTIADGDGAVGTEVCLEITGDDFDNIFGFQFTVEYDPNVLEFASGTGEILNNAPVSVTNTAPGEIRIRWDLLSLEGLSSMDPFTVATVCFTVLSDVETDVFFSGSSIAQEVIGEAGPISGVTYNDGVVNEGNTGGGGGPSAVFMDFSEEQIVPGQTLCQEVAVSDFTDISTFSFMINNPLGSTATPTIQNVNASLTGTLSLTGTTTATISYDHGGGSVSLTNGTVAFELCHDIPAGYANPNPQTITGAGTGSATTGTGETTDVNVVSGTASPPATGGGGDLTFSLSDEDGAVGEQVCLDLTTANHDNITAWQFSLNFNTSFLTYTNFTANPAYAGQNSDIQVFGSGPGELRVIWSDGTPQLDGFSFPDGTVLATFCFDILNAGPTTVDITNDPIEIVAANASGQQLNVVTNDGSVNGGITSTCNNGVQDGTETGVDCGGPDCDPCISCNDGIQNGNETGVDCGGPDCDPCTTCNNGIQDGTETGVDCGGPDCAPCDPVIGDNLTFDLLDGSGDVGDQVCLDITTFNFTGITAFQFSVNFDNDALNFVSSSYAQEFDDAFSPVSINEDSNGDIRITWVDQFLAGLDFDDGDVVITLCFEILDDSPTDVDLSGNPISATGSEVGGAGIDVDVIGGTVNGTTQQPTCNDGIQNGNETGVDCGGSCAPCMTMGGDCNDGIQNGQETGVDCGGPDCDPCNGDLVFDLLDATCDMDGNFCMDLMVTGFTDITGFQFDVNFDDALLDFENFTAIQAFDDIFSPVSVNQSGTGQLSVLWSYNVPDFAGLTLDDNTVIMTFCFSGLSDGSSTTITLSDLTGVDNNGLGIPVQGFGATASCGGMVDPCNNGVQDGQETGVDCGGPDCAACPSTCDDGIQNGDETGVDCGGSCAPCMVMPTCDDGVQNGQETGVDCGGPDCTPCTTDLVFDLLNATCDENGEVCVDLITTGFTNITGFQFQVLFDPAELTYESFMADPAFAAIFSPVNVTNPNPGELRILWVDNSPSFQGLTFDDGDQILKFCFSNVADGQSTLTLDGLTASDNTGMGIPVFGFGATVSCGGDDPCNNGVQDGNETGVDCGGDCDPCPPDPCNNGVQDGNETGVDCGGPDCVPCETDLTFTLANGTGGVGEEVCVDITAFDFDEITGFQFSINYDPELLDFESGTGNTSLPGLIAIDGSPGQVTVRWTGSSAVSLDNGDAMANLCFTVLGPNVCTANVVFSDSPTPISANNEDGDNITVTTNNGIINAGNPCADPAPNLVLDIGDATGGEGSQICLDVTVTDFIDITDLQFSVTYDADMLTFTGGGDFNLSGVGAGNFNSPMPGQITFDWESPGPNGVTVTNGTAIFSLCFTINEVGETVVQPSNSPLAILATNGTNQSVGVVPSAGIVNAGVPIGDALTFIIGNANGDVGSTVCIPMTVFNFDALAGFQFGMSYDTTLVDWISPAIVPTCPSSSGPMFDCVPGLNPGSIQEPNSGDIRVTWNDQLSQDRQVIDGSVIFELCFEVLSTDCAPISFANTIAVQFFNANVELISATLINGGINCSGQPPLINNATVNNTSCDRDDDGSISLSVLGGPNLTYSWTPNVDDDGPTVENLSPGFYTVIITNPVTGEFTSETFSIGSDPTFNLATANVTDVRCFGESNGSITIATSGGVSPFTIDWCGNLQDNQIQQNNLPEGTYCVTVTDANGCSREINEIEIEEPDAITIVSFITPITGPSTGALNIDVSGGTPNPGYTYQWTGPNNFMANTEDLSGLNDPGTYCVTVTDSRGCVEQMCFNMPEPNCMPEIAQVDVRPACFGEDNGAIDLTIASNCMGVAIAVVWTDENGTVVALSEDVDNLPPGTYSFAISQGTSMVTGNVEVNILGQIVGNGVVTNSTTGSNGRVDINPEGGFGPYTYTWTDVNGSIISTSEDIMGLPGGTYCVVIEDFFGCTSEIECYTVNTAPMALVSNTSSNALCADSTGSVEIVVENASLPISATSQPGGLNSTSNSNTIILDLPAGTYDVTVTDAQNQMITVTGVVIEAPSPVTLDQDPIVVSNVDEATCSGSITLNLTGGTPTYEVGWNQPDLSGPQIMQLCDGTYTPTVTDANGCEYVLESIVVGLLTGEGTTSLVDCPGDATGTVDLTVDGGEAPYTYSWTRAGDPDFSADTEDLQDVPEGVYTVIITDATGAQLMRTFEVETAAGFSVSTAVTSSYNGFGVSCPNNSDGSLAATISGVGTFSYEWRRNGSPIGDDSPTLSNVPAGEYTLIVTSDVGCIVEETLILTEPDPIQLVANITDATCEDARDGRIALEVSGGVGSYDFFWDNTRTTPTINFLLPGPYSVEVSDENDCFITQTFRVEAPVALSASATSTDATDDCNGTVNVEVSGGNGNYTYQWPQLVGQTGPSAEGLCPGEYMVVVRDGGGCQSITVTVIVRDRRFPCLSGREVITPNGDGLNEDFVLFCTDGEGFNDNTLEIFNRWGQLVFTADNYDCSQDGGTNCFNGTNNDGTELPEGPYYFVLDYANPSGDRQQLRGSLTILRE